ncbi:Zinc finger C2H2-type [Trinorchestia longiramus]|nr:Zinc finger C2H2-type [Trinorchestia longiramus]
MNQDGVHMNQDGTHHMNQDGAHHMNQDGVHHMNQDGVHHMNQDGVHMNQDGVHHMNQDATDLMNKEVIKQRIQESVNQKIQEGVGQVSESYTRKVQGDPDVADRSQQVKNVRGSRADVVSTSRKETQGDMRSETSVKNDVFDASSDSFASAELDAHLSDDHDQARHDTLADDDVSILRDDTSTVPDNDALRSVGITIQNNSPGMMFIPPSFSPSLSLLPGGFNSKLRFAHHRKSNLMGAGSLFQSRFSTHFLNQDDSLIPKHSSRDLNHNPEIPSQDGNTHSGSSNRDESSHPASSLHGDVMPGAVPSQSVTLDDLRSSLPGFEPPTPARKDACSDDPLHCPFCGKLCKRRDHLRLHIRIHTGEKPFKCPYCERRTNQKNNLKLHIRNVHPGLPVLVGNSW